jgi:hypothetical protein
VHKRRARAARVALACAYTWVCSPPPTAGNELPNRLGYAVMANAFLRDLGWPWHRASSGSRASTVVSGTVRRRHRAFASIA